MEVTKQSDELTRLKKENELLREQLNQVQSTYGDNWYDGFIVAKKMSQGGNHLDDLSDSDILGLSEWAEGEWLKKREMAHGNESNANVVSN